MSAATSTTPGAAPSPASAVPTSPVARFVHDTAAVAWRELRLTLRDPFSQVFALGQPIVFLLLFAPLLSGLVGGAMAGPGAAAAGESTIQWFLPGLLVMIALFGTGMTGSNLLFEMQMGSYERILASPLSRASIIVGRALKEFVPLVAQALILTLAAIPFGFEIHVAGVALGLVMLGLFGIGLGSLSYALGLASKNREWLFWTVQQSVTFPLLLLAGMMLPLESGPGWMQVASRFNPITYLVDAERVLFAGGFTIDVVWGFLAAAATLAVGLAVGVSAIRRATR
ncbi:ABC transporter permease [Litorihabitans aurantiacus]|uniref:Transport permease protein n=1 Tax=Litorihabitans aurantiacus TaxID=1930061 RepID=A0AA38CVD5_9MICO|nr:ABC transporter permease [Litorihabitans aurantiacus]GMA32755.1 transport permease protein [Litorihabitans aurantiacus]